LFKLKMVNLFLFLAGIFLFTFLVGKLIEKIRVPWIFAALILGSIMTFTNYFNELINSGAFVFLAELGMFFLLFIIGFEIDIKEILEKKAFLFKATFFIISLEAIIGSSVFHFVLGYSWFISLIVGFSFATVGEVVLIPILEEFKMVNTKLGQSILGIGILDDIIEVAVLVVLITFLGLNSSGANVWVIILCLFFLFVLTLAFRELGEKNQKFKFQNIETLFLFSIFLLFLFLGVGNFAQAMPLAAFLAGVAIKTFVPKKRLNFIKSETKSIAYGFFAPIFFFSVGFSVDFKSIFLHPTLLLLVLFVSISAKLIGSFIISKGYLSFRESVALGVGLSIRFSTSIIVIKILLDAGLLNPRLYSILIASSVLIVFIVPVVLSRLIVKWKLNKN
jgi:Kef-type K+ transport system membrane component KefB